MKREKSRECTFLLLFSNDFHAANEVAKQLDMLIENQNDINENKEDPIIAKEADGIYNCQSNWYREKHRRNRQKN